ncbi:hypothetical protein Tco_0785589 [Tanacetum coccineum]
MVLEDPSASIKVLLLKNPPMLQRLIPSRTQDPMPSSKKSTPSFAPVSKPMCPLVVVSSAKLQSPPPV